MNKTDLTTAFEQTSFLYGGNAQFIEHLYAKFLKNPASVDQHWRQFFASLEDNAGEAKRQMDGPSWQRADWPVPQSGDLVSAFDGNWAAPSKAPPSPAGKSGQPSLEEARRATTDSVRVLMMIRAYRVRGHLAADLDPLKLRDRVAQPELDPASYGFAEGDLDRPIFLDKVLGLDNASVRQIVDILKRIYCSTLGVEYMHISDPEQKAWIQERLEGSTHEIGFTPEGKKAILAKLVAGEGLENFLNVKYTGTKRFGLDGAESMIPALEQIIKRGGQLGIKEIVFGMSHRGRLNVLANVMSKPFSAICHEFKGGSSTPDEVEGSGDVKYHLGTSSDRSFDGNTVHLSLTANPS
ncbi:MAG: 2-oxoglutarate dehydrogenase E1 subunit family protein, partial [Aestuariivirga sp.]